MVNGPMGGPNVAHLTNQRPVLWAPDQSEASNPPVVRVRASWQHDGVIIISPAAKTRTRMGQTWAVLRSKSRDVRFINVIIRVLMMVLGIKLNEKKIGVKSFEKDNPIKWPRVHIYVREEARLTLMHDNVLWPPIKKQFISIVVRNSICLIYNRW